MMDKYYFYQSYYEALKSMKPSVRYAIREAIDEYMFADKEPVFKDVVSKSIWTLLLPTLHKSKIYFANGKLKSKTDANQKQNGSKSEANQKQIKSKTDANVGICSSKEKDKEKDKEITPISPKGTDVDFEKFWKVYPKHISKQEAKKAFLKAIKKVDLDVLINAVKKQSMWVQWQKDNHAFVPHASTWLNQGRWEDEEKVAEGQPEEHHPVEIMKKCPVCGSFDVATKGMYANCLSRDCGCSFIWSYTDGRWKEEA